MDNEINLKYQGIINKLQEKDYRLTDIRKAIIKILVVEKDITINDIVNKLKKTHHNVNIMSVYNTIDLLLKEHLIHANVFDSKQVHYELSDNMNDIHIICNLCHEIWHLDEKRLENHNIINSEKLAFFLTNEKKFLFSHFKLEVHGLCNKCQKHEENN